MMVSRRQRFALRLLLGLGLLLPFVPSGTADEPVHESSGEPITFNKHIARILWENCTNCHRSGEVGPFSLLTYQDAVKREVSQGDHARSSDAALEARAEPGWLS